MAMTAEQINELIETLSGLTILEVSELVKQLEEKWGVSAAAPVAVAAAGAAGGANAQDAGFPSWDQYEPEPSIWEKAGNAVLGSLGTALEPWMPGGAVAESAVGKHVAGNVSDVMDLMEVPARAAHGVIRGGYGLATGESPRQALNEGVETFGGTMDENGQRFTDWVGTQGGTPVDQSAAYWGTQLLEPSNLIGMGLFGALGKSAVKGMAK